MKDVIEHKFKFHEDDRGQRFQDVYGDNMPGSQINVTFMIRIQQRLLMYQ